MPDYSHLIPSPDELPKPEEDTVVCEKWLEMTLGFVASTLKKEAAKLHSGEAVEFHFPKLRDRGRGYKMWKKHWTHVDAILTERGYVVTNNTWLVGGRPPSLRIRMKPSRPKPVPSENPPGFTEL